MQQPSRLRVTLIVALLLLHGAAWRAAAQDAAPAAAPAAPVFKPEELEQLVAPIALYPDPLLAQVLMASTYPLEIVEAERWQKQNPNLKDQALQDALQSQSWDASVKSLTAFPPVLAMMNDKLDWTQKLGDAFLAQQGDVMDAVQRLRNKAEAAGNLKSTAQQTVTVEQAPANVQQNVTVQGQPAPPPTIVKIEPADPQVVYVPTYNPTVVYGAWPYPTYPPYSYYPPGYVATTSLLSFGVGMAVGAALWGGCDWGGGYGGHNNVNINVNNYNNFNKTNISNKNWQHSPEHRRGVGYRDAGTQQKYGRGVSNTAQSREAFRGRAEQGQKQLAQGAAKDFKPNTGGGRGDRPAGGGVGNTQGAGKVGQQQDLGGKAKAAGQKRPGGDGSKQMANRPQTKPNAPDRGGAGHGAGAFQGVGNGQQARMDSNRGHASRQSATQHGGGGGRGGGGGGRTGGGGGGGQRGGGGRRR